MTTAFQPDGHPAFVESGRLYQREYYQRHRDKKIAYARKYHNDNKERINEARRITRPSKYVSRGITFVSSSGYNRRYYREVMAEGHLRLRIKALQIVGGYRKPRCCACGVDDIFVLAINHKNGGGNKEVRNNVISWWKAIVSGKRLVDDLDVRCQNCNVRYEYERGRRRLPRNWQAVIVEETK